MEYWQRNGLNPQLLADSDIDPSGRFWLNLPTNEAGRTACGWTRAPEIPAFDPETHELSWVGHWEVAPIVYEFAPAKFLGLLSDEARVRLRSAERTARSFSAEDISKSENAIYDSLEEVMDRIRGADGILVPGELSTEFFWIAATLGIVSAEEVDRISRSRKP